MAAGPEMCHLAGLADTCSGPGRSRAEALTTWMACTTFLGLGRAGRVPPHDYRHPTIDWEKSGGSSASSYDAEQQTRPGEACRGL